MLGKYKFVWELESLNWESLLKDPCCNNMFPQSHHTKANATVVQGDQIHPEQATEAPGGGIYIVLFL